MHTSYAPDEITEDYIENSCHDLQCELENVLNNEGEYKQEMYDNAVQAIKHISAMLDAMMPDEDEDYSDDYHDCGEDTCCCDRGG